MGVLVTGVQTCALPISGLEDRSRRAAGLFAAAGIGAGSSVAVLLPNRIAFIEAMLGAQHIGAYAVPINWHFAPAEIAYILDDCGARVLVTEQDQIGRAHV